MAVRIDVDSNIESVIDSIEDVQDDIRSELEKRVGRAMLKVWSDARRYVLQDPHNRGNLFTQIEHDNDISRTELSFRVFVDTRESGAPYAPIVEFGSGRRTNRPFEKGNQVPPTWPSESSSFPPGYRYSSPDIAYNARYPPATAGYPTFYGFMRHIEDWMKSKGVQPYTGSYRASAAFIAAAIIEKGNHTHPFLRPAWFENEMMIKRAARHALRNATR